MFLYTVLMPSSIQHSVYFSQDIYSFPSHGLFSYIAANDGLRESRMTERGQAVYKFTVPWHSSHIHSASHCHVTSGGELNWTSS